MSKLSRIIIHHTAGLYKPNTIDIKHYHYLVTYDKKDNKVGLIYGKYKPEDNENCYDGKYAAHVGGMNTGSIGIAACCHYGYQGRKGAGDYPIQRVQFEFLCKQVALRCKEYEISIDRDHVKTHAEVGWYAESLKHPGLLSQNIGKIDIIFLPFEPSLGTYEVGDYIRNKVEWYYDKI